MENKQVSFLKTCINGINALSGMGILSIPYALSAGGWLSLILLILIAAAASFTGLLMCRCMDRNPNVTSYSDIASHAFGRKGKLVASFFTSLELYFVATGFLIMEGDNLHKLSPNFVMFVSFVICTITNLSMAVLGYLIYGQNVQSQVTLNLPTQKLSSKIAIYTMLAGPIAKYALTITPIATAIESVLPDRYQDSKSIGTLVRMSLLISTVVMAMVFPSFQSLTSLSGAALIVIVSFFLPCACYLKIFKVHQKWGTELAGILTIMLMSVVVGAVGTYSSIAQTVKHN
ncbi:amino acid transporter AVT1J-like [Populus nigra]|uniref:amino acid transporter AVT1J-like n=1 Tax=Populus nigra TaxID=3691 RepID=UPI002B27A2F5|nr:amino acid transporter AVT1J-like [Populus nigra]